MRLSTLFTPAALLACAAFASADEHSDVISLTADDFESKVHPEPIILVEFFAPWCGHCKALAPHYEEAATALKEKNVKLAKVDCVDQADLCQAHGVQGYPTMKVFRNGKSSDYGGPRKADGIISYMVKQSLPAVTDVTAANHDEFKNADRVVAIAYVNKGTDEPAPEFSVTAENHRDDYLFGITTDHAAMDIEGVTPPAIVVYRKFDEPKTVYPYPISGTTNKDIADWVKELSIPTIDEVTGDNYHIYADSGKPLAYLFIDPTSEDKDEQIKTIQPVAAEFKSKVNFVWIDAIKFGDHAKSLNLVQPKWPAFVIQDLRSQLKYPIHQSNEITTIGVYAHIEKFVAGTLVADLKSQAIPETQDGPVYVVVGQTFDKVVFDDSKDVFIEFYASWCGHCKRLAPIWDQLGEKYAHARDHLLIAKLEAQENDLPQSVPFRVTGFPTIKFKKAGTREFIEYDGERALESLVAFVEEHASQSLEPPVAHDDHDQVVFGEDHHDEHEHEHEHAHDEHDEL